MGSYLEHTHGSRYAPLVVMLLGLVLGFYVAGAARARGGQGLGARTRSSETCRASGAATLPGLAFLVAIFQLQRRVGGMIAALRSSIVAQTDRRVQLMHDVLAGSETLKVNAWEEGLTPNPNPSLNPNPNPNPDPDPDPDPDH